MFISSQKWWCMCLTILVPWRLKGREKNKNSRMFMVTKKVQVHSILHETLSHKENEEEEPVAVAAHFPLWQKQC